MCYRGIQFWIFCLLADYSNASEEESITSVPITKATVRDRITTGPSQMKHAYIFPVLCCSLDKSIEQGMYEIYNFMSEQKPNLSVCNSDIFCSV